MTYYSTKGGVKYVRALPKRIGAGEIITDLNESDEDIKQLGPPSIKQIDPYNRQIKIVSQDFLKYNLNYTPEFGDGHPDLGGALFDFTDSKAYRGIKGLQVFKAFYIIGLGETSTETIRQSVSFPGVKIDTVDIGENYTKYETARTVSTIEGVLGGTITYGTKVTSTSQERREHPVHGVTIREPFAKDVECQQTTKYFLSTQKTPKVQQPFTITGTANNEVKKEIYKELAARKHFAHISWDFSRLDTHLKNFGSNAQTMLSETTRPNIYEYWFYKNQFWLQVSATDIQHIQGVLFKAVDVKTKPL